MARLAKLVITWAMNTMTMCHFCRREPAERQCETCKRHVCIQCSESHNCYSRD